MLPALPPPAADSWCAPPAQVQRLAADDFRHGLQHWRLEAQDPRTQVQATGGVLDLQTPAGLTLWFTRPLSGDYAVRFTATALPAPASAGPLAGRVSDLNMFWNATEADGSPPRPRDGAFASYDTLRLYYAGFGANGNTSTRLRHYDGQGARTLLDGYADPPAAEPADRRGAMNATTRLVAGQAVQVQIVSRRPTPADPLHLRWSAHGHTLFTLAQPPQAALLSGWFALRTTASRLQLRDFEVLGCSHPEPTATPNTGSR
ncbi:MAG: hypothetical protein HY855_15025 [Burkholderiales bacterium]|nr:hypothetical protein [Burkholderiales bacterium]